MGEFINSVNKFILNIAMQLPSSNGLRRALSVPRDIAGQRRSSSGQCNSHVVQEGLGKNTRGRLEGCWKSPKKEARTDAEF